MRRPRPPARRRRHLVRRMGRDGGRAGHRPQGRPRAAPVQVAAAWLVLGASYRDPFTGQPCAFEPALDIATPSGGACATPTGASQAAVGMSILEAQRASARSCTPGSARRRTASAAVAAVRPGGKGGQGGAIAAWASRMPPRPGRRAAGGGRPRAAGGGRLPPLGGAGQQLLAAVQHHRGQGRASTTTPAGPATLRPSWPGRRSSPALLDRAADAGPPAGPGRCYKI